MKSVSFFLALATGFLLLPSLASAQIATDLNCTRCVSAIEIATNAINTNHIANGTLTNADLSETAAIVASKIADGAASGLDADLFDGLESSQFLRSDQSGSLSGNLAVSGSVGIGTTTPGVPLHIYQSGGILPPLDGGTELLIQTSGIAENWGAVSILSGTAGIASLYLGDADTEHRGAIRYDNANEKLYLSSVGDTKMTIDMNGNVGIGTTTPVYLLDVAGGSSSGAVFGPITASGSEGGEIALRDKNGSLKWFIDDNSSDNLRIYNTSSGTGDILLNPLGNGNVGIGTDSPTATLDVAGTAILEGLTVSNSGNSIIEIRSTSTGKALIDFSNDSTSDYDGRLVLDSDDQISFEGVDSISFGSRSWATGLTGSSATLRADHFEVDSSIHASDEGDDVDITDNVSVSGNLTATGTVCDSNGCIGSSSSGTADNLGNHSATQNVRLNSYWLSGDGGSEGISITSSGKVGIGTSSPISTLDVEGDLSINDEIAYPDPSLGDHSDSSTQGTIQYYIDQGYGHIHLQPGDYSIDDQLALTSNLTIEGSGWDSKIVMSSSSTADGIAKDGSGNGIDNVVLKDFFIEGEPSERTNCIYIGGSDSDRNTSIRIEGLKVQNCGEHGIHVKGTNQLIISNIVVSNCGTDTEEDHNIYLRRIDNGTISDVISKEAAANGFNGYDLDGVSITNFIARDNGFRGIRVSGSSRVTISNSQAIDNGEIGFMIQEELDEDDGTTHYSYNVTLSGCVAYGNDGSGVRLGSAGGYYVVTGCVIKNNGAYGVQLYSSPSDVIIDATVFDNNPSGSYTGETSSTIIGDIST